jgi:uncharacterized membrane protein YbhN (UPF0104 family)
VTQKSFERLMLVVALAMFFAAIFVLYRELENTSLADVVSSFKALPKTRVIAALALTAASYLLLTAYDFLALGYVGRKLRVRQTLFASFVAFAFTNNLGFALMSGSSVRYRIYSGFGLGAVEIGEIFAFCTVTYGLGVITVGGLMFLLDTAGISSILGLTQPILPAAGIAMLALAIAYLAIVVARRGPIAIGRYRLRLPSLGLGLVQICVASVDQALAGSVVYVLLPPDAQIGFDVFLGIYVIAAPLSLLSLVPGGLGVFETMVVTLLANTSKAVSLGSLIAYRLIYFVLPFVLAILLVVIYEIRRSSREPGWLRRLPGVLTKTDERDPKSTGGASSSKLI